MDETPSSVPGDPPLGTPVATRVILLGASNLTNAFPMVLDSLHRGLARPLDIYTAHGHGRSYGAWSRVLFRALPAITRCALWQSLATAPPPSQATLALVTDVGNDLIYGSSPETIAGWVSECLRRLEAQGAHTLLTLLPMASVERLSALRFHATKMIFFPRHRASFAELLDAARELNRLLDALARERGVTVIEQPLDWFGFDPIHIRVTRRAAAWQKIFAHWPGYENLAVSRASLPSRWKSLTLRPAERRLLGRSVRAPQPALRLPDTTVHVF